MSYSNTTDKFKLPLYTKVDSLNFEDFNDTNRIIDEVLEKHDDDIEEHNKSDVNSETGAHNIRYYNNRLSVFDGVGWADVITLKRITAQEYEHLSDEEKNNGTLYSIVAAEEPTTEFTFTIGINNDGMLYVSYPEGAPIYPEFYLDGKDLVCVHNETNLPLEIQGKYLVQYK